MRGGGGGGEQERESCLSKYGMCMHMFVCVCVHPLLTVYKR